MADFKGPLPESLFGSTLVLTLMDSATGWLESYGVKNKFDCGEILKNFATEIGRPVSVRTDNEPCFRGLDSNWKTMCRALGIHPAHSVPFEP